MGLSLWNRALVEKLIVARLLRKFPAFYGIRRFITMFTKAYRFDVRERK
jgi:hypothetical protein